MQGSLKKIQKPRVNGPVHMHDKNQSLLFEPLRTMAKLLRIALVAANINDINDSSLS